MAVNSIADFSTETITPTVKRPTQELGKDAFMTLMMAQMQNQDPTAPMDNSAMVAQMAQFSALEATTNMASALNQSQAYSLVGKGIVGTITNASTHNSFEVIGQVESAGVEKGQAFVIVGGEKIWQKDITQVFDAKTITGDTESLTAANNMIGKNVAAEVANAAGDKVIVGGKVERLTVENGKVNCVLEDGAKVRLFQVVEVAEKDIDIAALQKVLDDKVAAEIALKKAADEAAAAGTTTESGTDTSTDTSTETPAETAV